MLFPISGDDGQEVAARVSQADGRACRGLISSRIFTIWLWLEVATMIARLGDVPNVVEGWPVAEMIMRPFSVEQEQVESHG